MAVYEGVLRKISGGVNNTRGRWTIREFIEIGDAHLRNIALTNYNDELLKDSMGENVSLSIAGSRGGGSGRKAVLAIRTSNRGVVKAMGFPELTIELIFKTLFRWFVGIFVVLALWWLVATVLDLKGNINLVLLFGLALLFFVWPLLWALRVFRAWAAL